MTSKLDSSLYRSPDARYSSHPRFSHVHFGETGYQPQSAWAPASAQISTDELIARARRATDAITRTLAVPDPETGVRDLVAPSPELYRLRDDMQTAHKTNYDLIQILDATRTEKKLMHDEVMRLTDSMRVLESRHSPPLASAFCPATRAAQVRELEDTKELLAAEKSARTSIELRACTLEDKIRSLEMELRELQSEKLPNDLQRQRLEEEVASGVALIKDMRLTCEAYENQAKRERQKTLELQTVSNTAESDLELLRRQKNHIAEESNRLQTILSNERRETAAYMEEQTTARRSSRAREEETQTEIDSLIAKNAASNDRVAEMEKQVVDLRAQLESGERLAHESNTKAADLERQKREIQTALELSEERVSRYQMLRDINNVHIKHEDAVAEIARVRREARDLRIENLELDSELAQCERDSDAANRKSSIGDEESYAMSPRTPQAAPRRTRKKDDVRQSSASCRQTRQGLRSTSVTPGAMDKVRSSPSRNSSVCAPRKTNIATKALRRTTEPAYAGRPPPSLKARSQTCAITRSSVARTEHLEVWKNKALVIINDLHNQVADLRNKYDSEVEFSRQLQTKMNNVGKLSKDTVRNYANWDQP